MASRCGDRRARMDRRQHSRRQCAERQLRDPLAIARGDAGPTSGGRGRRQVRVRGPQRQLLWRARSGARRARLGHAQRRAVRGPRRPRAGRRPRDAERSSDDRLGRASGEARGRGRRRRAQRRGARHRRPPAAASGGEDRHRSTGSRRQQQEPRRSDAAVEGRDRLRGRARPGGQRAHRREPRQPAARPRLHRGDARGPGEGCGRRRGRRHHVHRPTRFACAGSRKGLVQAGRDAIGESIADRRCGPRPVRQSHCDPRGWRAGQADGRRAPSGGERALRRSHHGGQQPSRVRPRKDPRSGAHSLETRKPHGPLSEMHAAYEADFNFDRVLAQSRARGLRRDRASEQRRRPGSHLASLG